MPMMKKTYKQLERTVKGFANHRRIEALELLQLTPDLSLFDISRELGINFKTASEHVRRLALAELVSKRYEGQTIRHRLTSRGNSILKFLRILE